MFQSYTQKLETLQQLSEPQHSCVLGHIVAIVTGSPQGVTVAFSQEPFIGLWLPQNASGPHLSNHDISKASNKIDISSHYFYNQKIIHLKELSPVGLFKS